MNENFIIPAICDLLDWLEFWKDAQCIKW
jgi:hypothetical protein